jgi:hypothetical protein
MEQIVKDAVDDARALIQGRIGELREELGQLERALQQLDGAGATSSKAPGNRRRRRKGSSPRRASERKAPRRKAKGKRVGRGQRREQLLAAVKAKPGSTGTELAKAIGVQPSQVYGLLRKAQADKSVIKDGKGYRVPKKAAKG